MGNYNFYAPQILGEEWVPIRDEDTAFSPAVNNVEQGHKFTTSTSRAVRDMRLYINTPTPGISTNQYFTMAVYPAGQESQSGPISRVIIPCSNGGITGTGLTLAGGATSVPDAVANGSDLKRLVAVFSGGLQTIDMYFATNSYPVLAGKRILDVRLLYTAYGTPITMFLDLDTPDTNVFLVQRNLPDSVLFGPLTGPEVVSRQLGQVNTIDFGDIDHFWNPLVGPSASTSERLPWRYTDLQRFEPAGVNRLGVSILLQLGDAAALFQLTYAALEVTYCEEKRLIVGGGPAGAYGANILTGRDITTFAADPTLTAGAYTVTASGNNAGDIGSGLWRQAQYPLLNSVRQLYATPPHAGVQINIPIPLEDHIGDTFTQTTTMVLPQLSLHASGGTLTEPHAYGRQAAAQVYGVNTATQDIYDDISGIAATYPQVRFYARRFGSTTIPLTLTGVGGLAGSTVSITPGDFDQLTEIVDGWAEVTLRFGTPPSMGAVAGNPAWTWSATTETAGNRWEVLAACAPAISGIPGNLYNLVPAPNQLGTATYQPPSGDTVELTWMPQGVGSPWVTGASIDSTTDAVLIFSQDPPTVTGVSLSQLTQTVTGIGLNCGSLSCCIPSGIGYQRIAWSSTSLPASGFGAYELQRFDSVTHNFETIMLSTTVTGTGFNDFEARVGLNSVYRIRVLNIYNFAGAWSTQVTGAPPAPGVTGGCADATGALIFTSNADQSGLSNAAYVMQWDGAPDETFTLPEGSAVQFQEMYGRDGRVAFHGTERGLETFSRTLLINAAAIDPARLADTTTLRDLAWRDLPYVCVRDDIGDRWYSNVQVPAVSVMQNRTQYLARVDITELTRTPAQVNP